MSKNPHAVALGKLGAAEGGRARARLLTKQERIAIARLGGLAKADNARRQRAKKSP